MSVVKKKNTLYKPDNNSLRIDQRIQSYDYDFKMDNIGFYIFDIDLNCIYATDLFLTKKKTLKDIFPKDLIEFFDTFLRSAITKSQMIHVVINDQHIFFNTTPFLDHMNNTIGTMLYEVPFAKVQSLQIAKENTFRHMHINIVFDTKGNVFALEKINWDKYVEHFFSDLVPETKDILVKKWKSEKIIHSNINGMLGSDTGRYIYHRLLNYMLNEEKEPIRFFLLHNNTINEFKLLTTLSRFVDSYVYLLTTIEIYEENEKSHTNELITNMNFSLSKSDNSHLHTHKLCKFCSRIDDIVEEETSQEYQKNILYYNNNLPAIYDNDLDIPIFGKRGSVGQQSYKVLKSHISPDNKKEFRFWKSIDDFSISKTPAYLNNIYFIKDVCELCYDEWLNYFEINHIPEYNIDATKQ
jgi:hypothetical protein